MVRTASPVWREGTEPLRPLRGHLPFQGRLTWCGQRPPCGAGNPSARFAVTSPFRGGLHGADSVPRVARGNGTPPPAARAPPLSGEA